MLILYLPLRFKVRPRQWKFTRLFCLVLGKIKNRIVEEKFNLIVFTPVWSHFHWQCWSFGSSFFGEVFYSIKKMGGNFFVNWVGWRIGTHLSQDPVIVCGANRAKRYGKFCCFFGHLNIPSYQNNYAFQLVGFQIIAINLLSVSFFSVSYYCCLFAILWFFRSGGSYKHGWAFQKLQERFV